MADAGREPNPPAVVTTLREAVARAIYDAPTRELRTVDGDAAAEGSTYLIAADTVLRVVRDRLMGEDAVEAAGNGYHDSGNADTDEWAAFHAALAAAWASIEGDKT